MHPDDVERGFVGPRAAAIRKRKGSSITDCQARGAAGVADFCKTCFHRRCPPAHHRGDLQAERIGVGVTARLATVECVANQGNAAVAHIDRPAEQFGVGCIGEQFGNRNTADRRKVVAGKPDKRKQMAVERVFGQHEFGPGAIGKRHRRQREMFERAGRNADKQIMWKRRQRMGKRFTRVAVA